MESTFCKLVFLALTLCVAKNMAYPAKYVQKTQLPKGGPRFFGRMVDLNDAMPKMLMDGGGALITESDLSDDIAAAESAYSVNMGVAKIQLDEEIRDAKSRFSDEVAEAKTKLSEDIIKAETKFTDGMTVEEIPNPSADNMDMDYTNMFRVDGNVERSGK